MGKYNKPHHRMQAHVHGMNGRLQGPAKIKVDLDAAVVEIAPYITDGPVRTIRAMLARDTHHWSWKPQDDTKWASDDSKLMSASEVEGRALLLRHLKAIDLYTKADIRKRLSKEARGDSYNTGGLDMFPNEGSCLEVYEYYGPEAGDWIQYVFIKVERKWAYLNTHTSLKGWGVDRKLNGKKIEAATFTALAANVDAMVDILAKDSAVYEYLENAVMLKTPTVPELKRALEREPRVTREYLARGARLRYYRSLKETDPEAYAKI